MWLSLACGLYCFVVVNKFSSSSSSSFCEICYSIFHTASGSLLFLLSFLLFRVFLLCVIVFSHFVGGCQCHITNEAICKQTKFTSLTELISENAYIIIARRSCPCTSSLVSADENFITTESGYQLEETARSSQEYMDLSDFGWYWNVIARLLRCLHSSWSWKRDATVSEDYALMTKKKKSSFKSWNENHKKGGGMVFKEYRDMFVWVRAKWMDINKKTGTVNGKMNKIRGAVDTSRVFGALLVSWRQLWRSATGRHQLLVKQRLQLRLDFDSMLVRCFRLLVIKFTAT